MRRIVSAGVNTIVMRFPAGWFVREVVMRISPELTSVPIWSDARRDPLRVARLQHSVWNHYQVDSQKPEGLRSSHYWGRG